jgi:hypothetical protein
MNRRGRIAALRARRQDGTASDLDSSGSKGPTAQADAWPKSQARHSDSFSKANVNLPRLIPVCFLMLAPIPAIAQDQGTLDAAPASPMSIACAAS